jgi:7-cyano-7-deazaguanine synthase
VATALGVARHVILDIDLGVFGSSALTAGIEVPKDRPIAEMDAAIPVTYVPARNTIFLSLALGWAETLDASDLFIGANAIDYSGYPDCRPEFLRAFEAMARLGTKMGTEGRTITIHAPLIEMTKARIVQKGRELGVDFSLTRTCYDPNDRGEACGRCDACLLRLKGFAEAGMSDPAPYACAS